MVLPALALLVLVPAASVWVVRRAAARARTEEARQELGNAARNLALAGVVGTLAGGGIVWLVVRKVTRPLLELRDAVDAVGRGDFSRRIERSSEDEVGELAEAFNRMIASLQGSMAALEKAVEDLRVAQCRLVQGEKLAAIAQFVSDAAHELNNPLSAVIGFSDLLYHMSPDETMRPQLKLISQSAHRCQRIVQNLLGFARRHPPERSAVRVNTVLEGVLEVMAYEFRTSNVGVVRDLQGDLPAVMADPHQLQQVLVNILGNARQALDGRPGGRVKVRTRAAGGLLRIEIADNGPGIPADNLPRVFDPFFTTRPEGKGTGLGLSFAYGVVSEHGGRISASNEAGGGAAILIELPLNGGDAAEAWDEAPPRPRAGVSSGKAVLVVDDEEQILALAGALLEGDGHEVETCTDGNRALEVLKGRRFDAIVCDWKMPGLGGGEFHERLLAADPAAARRIIFISGDAANDSLLSLASRHGRRSLAKPFQVREFQDAVAAVIGSPA